MVRIQNIYLPSTLFFLTKFLKDALKLNKRVNQYRWRHKTQETQEAMYESSKEKS